MSFVSNVIWLLTVVLCTKLKSNGKFCTGLKGIERLECITMFTEVASQLSGNLHLFCTQLCTVFRRTRRSKKSVHWVACGTCYTKTESTELGGIELHGYVIV